MSHPAYFHEALPYRYIIAMFSDETQVKAFVVSESQQRPAQAHNLYEAINCFAEYRLV